MAYVVVRRNGRFEIRESVHTPDGPRARTLAAFRVLDNDILVKAARRATRPFDAKAVTTSARRTGAPVKRGTGRPVAPHRAFVEASRRMGRESPVDRPADPGSVLIDLLGFADAVRASQPPRRFQPLAFPSLAELAAQKQRQQQQRGTAVAGASGV